MDKKSFFQKQNLFDNLIKINSVGDYIWRHSWGHFEIVFLPILCIVAGVIYKIDKSNSISITGLMIMFISLFLGLLFLVKSIKSKSAISRKVFYDNEDLLKSVYFNYVLIYYSISAIVFALIYFVI